MSDVQELVKEKDVDQAAEWFEVKKLKENPKNPRVNEHAVKDVVKSIDKFGFGSPIVARKKNRMVIAGHTRLKAAMSLKLKKVPVRFLDISQSLADALMIADNKTSEAADWNEKELASLIAELQCQEIEIPGFDQKEINKLLNSFSEEKDHEEFLEEHLVLITCENEQQQEEVFNTCEKLGYKAKLMC